MEKYYTKCGREFEKSTKADTTGYHIPEATDGHITDAICYICPFVVDVKEGYPNQIHKRFECRAGSQPPNHENTYTGGSSDKTTLQIRSLDHNFCEAVIAFAQNHPKLGAGYNQDGSDCRRTVSVSCSQNKKGMAAKQELIDKFFPEVLPGQINIFEIDTSQTVNDTPEIANERKSKCPFLGSIGEKCIQCVSKSCMILDTVEFNNVHDCRTKTDTQCFNRFLDCYNYRKFYNDPTTQHDPPNSLTPKINYLRCLFCCNSSGYTGLPDGYSGQEYCFCQKHNEPKKHDGYCKWVNRHPDWAFEEKEKSMESITAEVKTVFNYSELDEKTVATLRVAEKEIAEIKMRTVYEIGHYLKLAHDELARCGSGLFGEWCKCIGFSRDSAENYIRAYSFIAENFGKPEDAIGIQPSLLFAASKPSAPAELSQAVVDGDITSHKDYQTALANLKKMEIQRDAAIEVKDDLRKKLDEVRGKAKEYQEKAARLEDDIKFAKENKTIIEKPHAPDLDMLPEELSLPWYESVKNAIQLLAGLDESSIRLLVRVAGLDNYAYMKSTLRMNADSASAKIYKLYNAITSAPAPAAEFERLNRSDRMVGNG